MEDQKYRDEEDLAEKLEGLKSKRAFFFIQLLSTKQERRSFTFMQLPLRSIHVCEPGR